MANDTVSVKHGRFTLEIPAGWRDESTITFSSPAKEDLNAPLSPKAASSYRTTLNVTLEVLPEGLESPAVFLQALGEALQQAGASTEDMAPPEAFELAGRPGALVERKVVLNNEPVRQFVAACFVGENVVVASAATSEARVEAERAEIKRLLAAIRFD